MSLDTSKAAVAINTWMKAHQDELVQFVRDLVRIDSRTYQEGAAVQWLAGKMREFRFDEVRVDPAGNCLGRIGSDHWLARFLGDLG